MISVSMIPQSVLRRLADNVVETAQRKSQHLLLFHKGAVTTPICRQPQEVPFESDPCFSCYFSESIILVLRFFLN